MLRVSPLLDPLKAYVENRFEGSKRHVPRTESSCNRLHYRATAILFLGIYIFYLFLTATKHPLLSIEIHDIR